MRTKTVIARALICSFAIVVAHVAHAQSNYEVLASFDARVEGLSAPKNGVVVGGDGALYGTTSNPDEYGGLFRIDGTSGALTWLRQWLPAGDTLLPSPLYAAPDGRMYFTLVDDTCQCVLQITPPGRVEEIRPTFTDDTGFWPHAGAIEGADGFLYGSTTYWGPAFYYADGRLWGHANGTVWKLKPDVSDVGVALVAFDVPGDVYDASGRPWVNDDGPFLGSDGCLYSMGQWDYERRAADAADIHRCQHASDGASYFAVVLHSSGEGPYGAIYRVEGSWPAATTTLIYNFDGANGAYPSGELVEKNGALYGTTTAGGPLNGGVVYRLRVDTLSSIDLVETTVTDPPAFIAPGGSFAATDTVKNQGGITAGPSVTRYFLSQDAVWTASDLKLTGGRYVTEVVGGMTATGTTTLKVPLTVPVGTYWLFACADAPHDVSELDESNNCLPAVHTVAVARPDLVQTVGGNLPVEATPGSSFGTADTVTNPTAVDVGTSTTRYYLSVDAVKGTGDILLFGKRAVASLAPGGSSSGTTAVTIPDTTPPGTYRLLTCADDLLKVTEADESNNCTVSLSGMRLGWPDLVTVSVDNPTASATVGGQLTITSTVANQGEVTAAASVTRYYLSLDVVKNAGAVLLTGKRSVPQLLPGVTASGSKKVTVPSTTAPGSYYVIACADDPNKLGESNETNNCRASSITVTVRNP